MFSKRLAMAAAAGISLLIAAPAFAHHSRHHFKHRGVVVHPQHYGYVVLRPVIVYRQPVYLVTPPAPVYPAVRVRLRQRF